jgi:acyl dehydratase
MMVNDDNPLFLNPEYAKQTKYGDVLYPPFAPVGIMSQGSPSMASRTFGGESGEKSLLPPTPGSYFINMAMEWEWFKPVVVGDWLTSKTRLADVYIKSIRIDPKAFWIVLELQFANQKGEDVCIVRNILLSHRSPDEITADS